MRFNIYEERNDNILNYQGKQINHFTLILVLASRERETGRERDQLKETTSNGGTINSNHSKRLWVARWAC